MSLPIARACCLAALLLGPARAASASAPFTGFVATPGCTDFDASTATLGELIALKRPVISTRPDAFLFDLRNKGGAAIDGTAVTSGAYESYGNWGGWQDVERDVAVVRVAMPPVAPGAPGRVAIDTATISVIDLGVVSPLEIGNSLPVGLDQGIGLSIPADGSAYPVDFGSTTLTYPRRTADGAITVAFAPLADLSPLEVVPGACTVSGEHGDPTFTNRGMIRGYDVYRIPAGAGVTGSAADFTAALTDADPATGFQAFIDLNFYRGDVPTDVTVDATLNDLAPADGAVFHNPDGRMYSGDEVILWTDAPPGPGRAHPERAPVAGTAYVYAVQPVSVGSLSNVEPCFSANCVFDGAHARDLDGNGSPDSIDLDSIDPADLAVEFISPQADPAEGGLPGLGLTWGSQLLVSSAIHVGAGVLPADVLRRSTEVTSLSPVSPALATILPLGPEDVIVTPFAGGDVDPDPTIIESRTHPLVFYDVPGRDIRLDITGAPGSRRVRVTF